MVDRKPELTILAVVIITLTIIIASTVSNLVLAVKSFVHVRGVKVLKVHTVPSKVTSGSTFGLRGVVVNNSTATITFANGTCTSPLSVTFNKNALSVPQTTTSCKAQQLTLKPGSQSPILISKLSGNVFRATSPGSTNATLIFKYGVITPASKSPIADNISRVYTFNILPSGATSTPRSTPSSQPGVLRVVP